MAVKQIAGSLTAPDGSYYVALTDGAGNLSPSSSTTGPTAGSLTVVASSASAVTILGANTLRKGASVYNDSTSILYLGLSVTTPSATVYTVQLGPGQYYEVPFGYTGLIRGIWASANGNARVMELT